MAKLACSSAAAPRTQFKPSPFCNLVKQFPANPPMHRREVVGLPVLSIALPIRSLPFSRDDVRRRELYRVALTLCCSVVKMKTTTFKIGDESRILPREILPCRPFQPPKTDHLRLSICQRPLPSLPLCYCTIVNMTAVPLFYAGLHPISPIQTSSP